jgi:hypothetical protein
MKKERKEMNEMAHQNLYHCNKFSYNKKKSTIIMTREDHTRCPLVYYI